MKFTPSCFATLLVAVAVAAVAVAEEDEYYNNKFSVCEDSTVVVKEVSLMCDSPGAYYYGSSKYRNSQSCQAGDKAKLVVDFYIPEDLEEGTNAYLTLKVQGYGSVETVVQHTDESLCDVIYSSDGSSVCPQAGYYTVSDQFYWGSKDDSYEYSFIPKVVVGIASSQGANQFDLGGANTNSCNGGYLYDLTSGVRKTVADTFTSFVMTFGILSFVLLSIALAGFYIMHQADKARRAKPLIVDEETFDEMSYKAIGDNKSLVDV